MNKRPNGKKNNELLKITYCVSSVAAFLGGTAIYAFFRNINNMTLFHFFPKPLFLDSLYKPIKTESIWSNMFIYNLPYGLWCFSGLLLVRGVWLHNAKWRTIYSGIFTAIVMSYVILKLPGITPGTFDVLDLVFMGFFAFMESLIFNMFIRRILR
jgi:hypothetical protein